MNTLSPTLFSSICKSIKKECILKAKMIPYDHILVYLMKLFTLVVPFNQEDENDTKKHAEIIINTVSNFFMSNHISMVTIEIQIYFNDHHISKESVLEKRHQVLKLSTDSFLQHILQKRIAKNKEDSDQLYYLISCYIILFSGAGDPTDDEVLKETTVALKSILSTKEIIRFASKANSVKEIQLGDVCSIVTGIRIFNKDSAKKSTDGSELLSHLQKALQKCNNFLECKSREMEERSHQMTKICLLHRNSSYKGQNFEEINKIKAHIILLQQILSYFRILNQECHSLNEEFQVCCVTLEQRLTRVRKTVKCRAAIPVVEIYPQFKDISLSWDKIQELSVLLNHVSEIVYDICEIFDKISEPNLQKLSSGVEYDLSIRAGKEMIFVENLDCELIRPETTDDFYSISIEYSGYCLVTFVEEEGVVTPGVKEYGLIKYKNKQYCFSTIANANKFCLNPEKYINKVRSLSFIFPEAIHLLNLEKYLQSVDLAKACEKKQPCPATSSVQIQTEIHPIAPFKDYSYTSSVWQLQQKIVHLAQLKNYRTHSVQTNESIFRRNICTQTEKKKPEHELL